MTLGGDVGRFLGRTVYGLLLSFWSGVAAAFILAPNATRRAIATLPPAAAAIYGWRIPQKTWRIIVEGTRALIPEREDEETGPAPSWREALN